MGISGTLMFSVLLPTYIWAGCQAFSRKTNKRKCIHYPCVNSHIFPKHWHDGACLSLSKGQNRGSAAGVPFETCKLHPFVSCGSGKGSGYAL